LASQRRIDAVEPQRAGDGQSKHMA
jgi:hypothetical protein